MPKFVGFPSSVMERLTSFLSNFVTTFSYSDWPFFTFPVKVAIKSARNFDLSQRRESCALMHYNTYQQHLPLSEEVPQYLKEKPRKLISKLTFGRSVMCMNTRHHQPRINVPSLETSLWQGHSY